jgi:two-component system OmpR family sensor kinase
MWATGLTRRRTVKLLWLGVAAANLLAIALLPALDTLPFRVCCIGLALGYAFGIGGLRSATSVLLLVACTSGLLVFLNVFGDAETWEELVEGLLIVGLFLPLVLHVHQRQARLEGSEALAGERAQLLDDQERLLQDVSHELRTPIGIARGHLELLQREAGLRAPELGIALDELERVGHTLDRLLLVARAEQGGSGELTEVEIEPFLEDVFLRWSELAPRPWRLGSIAPGVLRADREGLRIVLDTLLENAVQHTERS